MAVTKTPAASITITRAEGPHALCDVAVTFKGRDVWARAHAWLVAQGPTLPANGGYDKHDFVVTFADGNTYEGRLDCKAPTCENNDLDIGAHIIAAQSFFLGERPEWYPAASWEKLDAERAAAQAMLDTYEISSVE